MVEACAPMTSLPAGKITVWVASWTWSRTPMMAPYVKVVSPRATARPGRLRPPRVARQIQTKTHSTRS